MMFPKPKFTVYDVARDFRLTIQPVDDLPDGCAGFLESGPEPTYIAVNARLSPEEQIFTIAHELGHYALHPNLKTSFQSHWLVNQQWGSFSRRMRRVMPKVFSHEDEANLWAILLLLALGATRELWHHVKAHPENNKLFYLALLGVGITAARQIPFLWLKILFRVEITPK